MSVGVSKANLADALKRLRVRWAKARSSWDDETTRRFEEEFLEAIEPRIRTAIKGLDHVADLIAAARRECEDDR